CRGPEPPGQAQDGRTGVTWGYESLIHRARAVCLSPFQGLAGVHRHFQGLAPLANHCRPSRADTLPRGQMRCSRSLWWFAVLSSILFLSGCHASPRDAANVSAAPTAERSDVRFTDVAAQMGLDFRWKKAKKAPLNILEISSAGAGFIDY